MAIERITPSNQEEWRRVGLHHLQRYELAGRFVAGRRVLDLACGNGYGSFALANFGAKSVEGVDLDQTAIDYARRHYQRPGLTYSCRDAFAHAPIEGGYDAIVSFETIEHLADPVGFVNKLHTLLSKDGILIISAPNALENSKASHPVANPFHLSEPTYDEMLAWLSDKFFLEQEWEQSPLTVGFNEQLERLKFSSIARIALRLERFIKSFIGTNALPEADRWIRKHEAYCQVTTSIVPLLRERRSCADVFIFVCRPS